MDEYVRDFVQEGEENVTELNNALLELEREPGDEAAMDRIFRVAHTLKGNAGAMGFDEASDLAHAMEDLLDVVRAGEMDVSAELMDDVFVAVDEFEAMLDDVRAHGEIRTDPSDTIDRLRAVEAEATGARGITEPSEGELDAAVRGLDDLDEPEHTVYHVRLAVVQDADVNNAALVVDALEDAFDLLGTTPARDVIEADDASGRIDAVFGSAVTPGAIEAALEPVEAVDDWLIADVTARYRAVGDADDDGDATAGAGAAAGGALPEDPGADIDEDVAQEMSVDELLGEFDEYDDLDALVEEMDDVSGFDDLGEAGSFDDLDLGDDLEPADEPAADPLAGDDDLDLAGDDDFDLGDDELDLAGDDELDLGDDAEADAATDAADADAAVDEEPEQVEDAASTFAELKQEVDPVGFDELQDELDELEFDEYSDEEEVGFDELLGDDFEEDDDDFFASGSVDGDVDDILVDDDVTGFDEADDADVDAVDATADAEAVDAEADAGGVEAEADADALGAEAETDADAIEAEAETDADAIEAEAETDADAIEAEADADAIEAEAETDAVEADVDVEVDADAEAVAADAEAVEAADASDAHDDAQTADAVDEFEDDAFALDDGEVTSDEPAALDDGEVTSDEPAALDDVGSSDDFALDDDAADAFETTPDVDGFDDPATAEAGMDDAFDEAFGGDEFELDAADPGSETEIEGVDDAWSSDDALASAADDLDTDAFRNPVEADDSFDDADDSFGDADGAFADADDSFGDADGEFGDIESADFDADADLDFGEETTDTESAAGTEPTADTEAASETEATADAADVGTAEDAVDESSTPMADADTDLESVEVGEFQLDDEPAAGSASTDVETGDFGTDTGSFGGDTTNSSVDYGDLGAGGFDDAPEDEAASPEAPEGEMEPEDARALVERTLPIGGDSGNDGDVQSVRVDVDQVDRLLNLVEGLVTNRVRLRRSVEGADPAQLDDDLDELEDITGELQDTVMDIRLVPLKMVANSLPRVVRDVSRDQGKTVDFEMEGEDVEMDRTILDQISDPLVHLVRNAVDHGIETPAERADLEKPDAGTVTLEARRARDRVVVEVSDDGRGLDPDVLRDEAVEEGILDRNEADALSDDEARELVFHPGFSTAPEVTDVSGRGVGMDVVRSTVEDLDGNVDIESELGTGTTIRLVLPVSVAIDDVLFVECGDEEFGIPTKVVRDIGSAATVEQADDREVVRTDDGDETPLVRLGDALGTPGGARADGGGMLLHVRGDVRDVALHCDRVQGQQEVVVKPYDDVLGGIPGLSGATVLGEGEVVNILDVQTL